MPKKVPGYCLHKPTGQARVRIDGRDVWLGKYGSPESHRKYSEVIADWQSSQEEAPSDISVGQFTQIYLKFARSHYLKNGEETSELGIVKTSLRWWNRHFRQLRLADFGPRHLKQIRESLISADLSRNTVNKHVQRIRRAVRWAVSEEYCKPDVLVGLEAVRDLQRGRTNARETDPVKPVQDALVDAIQQYVREPVWAMVQLQRLSGMRPGEVLQMRICDIDTSRSIWEYIPQSHKLEHHGKKRIVYLGPNAQAALQKWLMTVPDAYFFSPDGKGSRPYTRAAYTRAIARACDLAGIPRWSPNQLRHLFATNARREAGIEATSASLGHSNLRTTEVYAERSAEAARDLMAKIG